jgi:hypothetical protein
VAEEEGEVEMVALDIEEEEEEEDAASLSCYEALEWEQNHNITQTKGNWNNFWRIFSFLLLSEVLYRYYSTGPFYSYQ